MLGTDEYAPFEAAHLSLKYIRSKESEAMKLRSSQKTKSAWPATTDLFSSMFLSVSSFAKTCLAWNASEQAPVFVKVDTTHRHMYRRTSRHRKR